MLKLLSSLKVVLIAGLILCSQAAFGNEFTATQSERLLDISGNGRYMLQRDGFQIPGMAVSNLSVLDFQTKEVDPVNYDPAGSFIAVNRGAISADGRYVAFESSDNKTLYFRDRQQGTTRIISNAADGSAQNGDVSMASISPDGNRIIFFTSATNLVPETLPAATATTANLILWERGTGTLSLAARAHDGAVLDMGVFMDPGLCLRRFSADGKYIVFGTPASNAVPGASVTIKTLVLLYRRNLDTGELLPVSTNASGDIAAANYTYPAISNDGSKVAFITASQGVFGIHINGTAFNFGSEVLMKNLETGAIVNLSPGTDGNYPDGQIQGTYGQGSSPLSMNGDATQIAYQSNSGNLAPGNTEKRWGVFLATVDESGNATVEYLSGPKDGSANNSQAANPIFGRDSGILAFVIDDRDKLGLEAGEGWVYYGQLPAGSLIDFFEPGAIDSGDGLIYSPSMGWLQFIGDSKWAFSHSLNRTLYFMLDGPTLGSGSGIWFYLVDDSASSWAYTAASWWQPGGNAPNQNGFVYIVSGRAGALGWFYAFGPSLIPLG